MPAIVLSLATPSVFAQSPRPGSIEACAVIESGAERLACYDAFAGRAARNPRSADAAAAEAKQAKAAEADVAATALPRSERARRAVSD